MAKITLLPTADWQSEIYASLARRNEYNQRLEKEAKDRAIKLGLSRYDWDGMAGAGGIGDLRNAAATGSSGGGSDSGNSNFLGGSNNSLLSSLGLGPDGNLFDAAKDMARFRLGLDQEQGRFARGLREEEAQSNFGRTTKLTAQQLTGQQDLEGLRQDAMTQRNTDQLANNLDMLNTGNNFNLLILGKNRAAALRGLR